MFLYANEQKETIKELLETAVGLDVELTLGEEAQIILKTSVQSADYTDDRRFSKACERLAHHREGVSCSRLSR